MTLMKSFCQPSGTFMFIPCFQYRIYVLPRERDRRTGRQAPDSYSSRDAADNPTNRVNNLMLAKEESYNVTISLVVYFRSLTVFLSSPKKQRRKS